MGVWAHGSQFAGYDYVQTSEPVDPEEGEMWYDMDSDRSLAYTGTEWQQLNIIDHGQLAGIVEDAHHAWPVPTSGILDSAVTAAKLAFNAVTQAEFNDHADDTTNPHNVTASQTGALTANTATESGSLSTSAGWNTTTVNFQNSYVVAGGNAAIETGSSAQNPTAGVVEYQTDGDGHITGMTVSCQTEYSGEIVGWTVNGVLA